jgi:hypothetical protein
MALYSETDHMTYTASIAAQIARLATGADLTVANWEHIADLARAGLNGARATAALERRRRERHAQRKPSEPAHPIVETPVAADSTEAEGLLEVECHYGGAEPMMCSFPIHRVRRGTKRDTLEQRVLREARRLRPDRDHLRVASLLRWGGEAAGWTDIGERF